MSKEKVEYNDPIVNPVTLTGHIVFQYDTLFYL